MERKFNEDDQVTKIADKSFSGRVVERRGDGLYVIWYQEACGIQTFEECFEDELELIPA